ncbi:hypothetical protein BDE36_1761 [Arcticibacter tournemirensis]|uniref:Tape measure protein N-terminal domain-containing protein n=1 Tax=Arcticibacter tournemirensis TaxID=699437 RepID=A0A5M9HA01_9SPHI|nr:tape measure protein [Arcticibacter tournemirensis]KAA8483772.1 hypothetical protein F1649_07745 [Arcticibacter tournemirensis]TQM50026.1 hypothetical protein BDE36_1761 [Arcticibacter tournemirensis]
MAKSRTDVESVVKLVINGEQAKTSMKEITDSIRKYEAEFKNMRAIDNPQAYRDKAEAIGKMRNALKAATDEMKGANKESKNFLGNWKEIAGGIVGGFGITAGIGMIKSFGVSVFETTAKFQKLEAVLTTTLGSKSAAQMAMQQIQTFAAETPFQVDELTDAYVKLANQGFKPSMDEMRKLGDLSASTGKDFNQLAEAMIDAQTGEFERLKEFGIRAEKDGDKVRFTFKGITQEVDFTSSSIRNYITELGSAEGITGSMAGISETLSGQVSNLGDSWDTMLKTVGEETTGVFSGAISIMNQAIGGITAYLKNLNIAAKYNAPGTGFWERLASIATPGSYAGTRGAGLQRSMFTAVSETLDKRVADSKYFKQLIDLHSELTTKMKDIDRTTKEGSATYQLYADKIKLIKDRWQSISSDRHQEVLRKESEASKKAAEEAEKRRKEHEKLEKQFIKEGEALDKTVAKMKADFETKGLDGLDQRLSEISNKYDPLIQKAKALNRETSAKLLESLKSGEVTRATDEEKKKKEDETDKQLKGQYGRVIGQTNSKFDKQSSANTNAYADGEMTEEQYVQAEYDLETQRLLALQLLAQTYGESSLEYEKQLSQRKLEQKKKEVEQRKQLAEGEKAIQDATMQNMADGVGLLKGLVNQRGAAFKALLIAEKAIAISQVVMNTQKEIAGYYAAYAAIPGGAAVAAGLSTAAKIRAAISIGTIVAAGAKELSGGSDSKGSSSSEGSGKTITRGRYAKGGFSGVPDGPPHSQGGIKMVDALTGAIIGEMEGGEPILSKDTYRNNKATIDALLYSSQRRNGANISINTDSVTRAERFYRTGGISEPSAANNPAGGSDPVTIPVFDTKGLEEKLERLAAGFDEFKNKPWEFPMRTFYEADEKNKRISNNATA